MAGIRPSRRASSRVGLSFVAFLLAVTGIWIYGLFAYAEMFPTTVNEPDKKTDAIVVLTGGSGRLETGISLLQQERAETLFVSGVYQGIDVNYLLALVQDNPDDLAARVEVGNATNTRGNALETATWASNRDIRSLRLVTAAYHMPRSLLEFSRAMDDIELVAHPVFPDHVKTEWWLWPGTTALIIKEYNKYLLAWVRLFIEQFMPLSFFTPS